jgi:hypothetical protein
MTKKGLPLSPDPNLAQITKYLNNLREELDEYQCSNCHNGIPYLGMRRCSRERTGRDDR